MTITYYVLIPIEQLLRDVADMSTSRLFRIRLDGPAHAADNHRTAVVRAADGTAEALAFDHGDIIEHVINRMQSLIWSDLALYSLLPEKFTLRHAQSVFEAVLGYRLNKDLFRRRLTKSLETVEPTGEMEVDVDHRPAELYRLVERTGPEHGGPTTQR